MKKPVVTILIPVRDEEKSIVSVLTEIRSKVTTPFVIIVIDDRIRPTDRTPDIAEAYASAHAGIKVLRKKPGDRNGYAYALLRGIKSVTTPYFVFMMADACDNIQDLDSMVQLAISGSDIVCASRYSRTGKRIGGPVLQKLLSVSYNSLLFHVLGIPTRDATNAFKLFRTSIIRKTDLASEMHFALPLYLTVSAFRNGFRISEIPTVWQGRKVGISKFGFLDNAYPYIRALSFVLRTGKGGSRHD